MEKCKDFDGKASYRSLISSVLLPLLIVAWVYFSGFNYLNYYFSHFGIFIAEINPTEKEVFVSSFYVFAKFFNFSKIDDATEIAVIIFLVAAIIAIILRLGFRFPAASFSTPISLASGFFLFWLAWYVSFHTARIAASEDARKLPEVMLVYTDAESRFPSTSSVKNSELLSIDIDRLIYMNETDIFLYRQISRASVPVLIRVKRSDNLLVFSPRSAT